MRIENRSPVCAAWLLLALPMIFFSGCMSGEVSSASLTQDGRVLAFTDHTFWSTDVCVAAGRSVRRLGSTDGREYLNQAGDLVVWFNNTAQTPAPPPRMTIHHLRENRTEDVNIPAEGPFGPDNVMFGPSQSILLKIAVYPKQSESEPPPEPKLRTELTTGFEESLAFKVTFKYLRWSAKSGWSETSDQPKDFELAASPAEVWRTARPRVLSVDGEAEQVSPTLVEFGPEGRNARRTVWVRPDGSVVEVSRQNDIPGRIVVDTVLLPVMFWNPFYWGDWFVGLPYAADKGLTPVDNSEARRRLDQLVKERTGAKPQR